MRIDIIYPVKTGNTVVSTIQEGGPHWVGGTVIDVLNEHLSGERPIKQIVVYPDAVSYDDPEPARS